MKKVMMITMVAGLCIPAMAQWSNAKGKWVLGMYAGSNYNPIKNNPVEWYQFNVRETRYLTNRIGLGAELGYTSTPSSQGLNGPRSLNLFGHLRVISGFYGDFGYGFAAFPGGRDVPETSAKGRFWALGVTKKIGNHLALDLQYRNAPTPSAAGKNYANGLRLGLQLKF